MSDEEKQLLAAYELVRRDVQAQYDRAYAAWQALPSAHNAPKGQKRSANEALREARCECADLNYQLRTIQDRIRILAIGLYA